MPSQGKIEFMEVSYERKEGIRRALVSALCVRLDCSLTQTGNMAH